MGVDVFVQGANDAEHTTVECLFAEWDDTFSRFRPQSELNRVNECASETVLVSELFARVLRIGLGASRATAGLVDPTLGVALEAAGYDRDFQALAPSPHPTGPTMPGAWRSVRLSGVLLSRPPGLRLDLNGVVKGLAVDEALELIAGPGFVAAGGDIATRGDVVVALPRAGSIRLLAGGLATSGTTWRRWWRGGALQHHLIDPRTGKPACSRWNEVTVAAASCLAADVAAKCAFLLSGDGPDWLDEQGLPGRFVEGAAVVANAAWQRSDRGPELGIAA
jgi:thiamine biosynthesis lipoprotein